jgi:hypothetical protein
MTEPQKDQAQLNTAFIALQQSVVCGCGCYPLNPAVPATMCFGPSLPSWKTEDIEAGFWKLERHPGAQTEDSPQASGTHSKPIALGTVWGCVLTAPKPKHEPIRLREVHAMISS